MNIYNWIAIAVSLIAVGIAIRAEWRVSRMNPPVKFKVEARRKHETMRIVLWNEGYKSAHKVRVSPAHISSLKTQFLRDHKILRPGASVWFLVHETDYNRLPEHLLLNYRTSKDGKERSVAVPLVRSDVPGESDDKEPKG